MNFDGRKPKLCRFRADKSAQRILAESIARELGPLGIHVAYVLIDAAIDTPTMRKRFPEASNDFFHKAIRHCRRALAPRS
jgi:NAD(P)-dependent dehydrogenase (short-subunit alcohol dehydrogenase family)